MAAVDTVAANTAFAKVARVGLECVELADVRAAALLVWYGQEDPALDAFGGPYRDEAIALVERLSYYNVVPLARKKALKRLVQKLQTVVRPADKGTSFERNFQKYIAELQPLQSRDFEATMRS
nr:hypothetical protein [Thiomonas sp.]